MKSHPIYKNLSASSDGLIFNKNVAASLLDDHKSRNKIVSVKIDGKFRHRKASHLIYEVFKGSLDANKTVFHVDDDISNLRPSNLIAMTKIERQDYVFASLTYECARHPTFRHLVATKDGRVFSLAKESFIAGHTIKETGYVIASCGLEFQKLIYECFHGLVDSKIHSIDHKNNIHDDNKLSNLQKLTLKEHLCKTRTDNPTAKDMVGKSMAKPITRIKKDHRGEMISIKQFSHFQEAFDETRAEFSDIKLKLSGIKAALYHTRSYKGFFWNNSQNDDLPDEEWREMSLPELKFLRVSSMGRVQFGNGRRSFGSRSRGYRVIEHNRKRYRVHFLICLAFHGKKHPTFIGDKSISVDHINNVKDDNKAKNLRWATSEQQSNNRKISEIIVAFDNTTDEKLGEFTSTKEVAIFFKIHIKSVQKILRGAVKYSAKLPHVKFQKQKREIPAQDFDILESSAGEAARAVSISMRYSKRLLTAFKISTGEKIVEYGSINDMSRYFAVSNWTIRRFLHNDDYQSRVLSDIRFQVKLLK